MVKKQMKLCENLLNYFFQNVKQAQRKKGKAAFFFGSVDLLYYQCQKKIFEIRKTKRRFHYGVTLEENYEKLENIPKELCLLQIIVAGKENIFKQKQINVKKA